VLRPHRRRAFHCLEVSRGRRHPLHPEKTFERATSTMVAGNDNDYFIIAITTRAGRSSVCLPEWQRSPEAAC
jgi:hypothetical protein